MGFSTHGMTDAEVEALANGSGGSTKAKQSEDATTSSKKQKRCRSTTGATKTTKRDSTKNKRAKLASTPVEESQKPRAPVKRKSRGRSTLRKAKSAKTVDSARGSGEGEENEAKPKGNGGGRKGKDTNKEPKRNGGGRKGKDLNNKVQQTKPKSKTTKKPKADVQAAKAKASRKSSAYHQAKLRAKKEGLSKEEQNAAAKKATHLNLVPSTLSAIKQNACVPCLRLIESANE